MKKQHKKLAAAPTPAPSAPVEEKKVAPVPAPTGDGEVVPAPMAGIVLSVNKNVGDDSEKRRCTCDFRSHEDGK